MDNEAFRQWSARAAEWGADYRNSIAEQPVRARTRPGEIAASIAKSPPEQPEPMETIFADFEQKIVPA